MIINHNMNAMNAHRNMSINSVNSGKSMEKLASGLRINKAGDDAAGLAISEKMRGQIRGLDQASRNAQDGISMIQTAEGALNETHSILQRMRELAVQGSNSTNDTDSRDAIQAEMNQLTSEINRIGNTTEFNTQKLLKGGGTNTETGAVKTGAAPVLTTDLAGVSGGLAISINGVAVDATATKALDGTQDIDDTILALQTDLDATFDGTAHGGLTFTVGKNAAGDKITITSGNSTNDADPTDFTNLTGLGASAKVDLSGTSSDILDAIGMNDDVVARGKSAKFTSDLQIGANNGQKFTVEISDMRASALGISGTANGTKTTANSDGTSVTARYTISDTVTNGTTNTKSEAALDISNHDNATAAIQVLDDAINRVSEERSSLGAFQNRLEHTIANLGTSSENLTSAESRIRDVDMAKEMMNFSKNNILSQAAQAMLAQANQQPQGVLQLLR